MHEMETWKQMITPRPRLGLRVSLQSKHIPLFIKFFIFIVLRIADD